MRRAHPSSILIHSHALCALYGYRAANKRIWFNFAHRTLDDMTDDEIKDIEAQHGPVSGRFVFHDIAL